MKLIAFTDLKTQYNDLRSSIHKRIDQVLEHGQYIMGPEVIELENKLANFVGVKHCISASSGSDTLLIAMMALNIKRGDEVITTPFTYFATGEMVSLLGAIPVFVDIDPKTYNIDPKKIKAAVTTKTKAIIPVSLFGQCANMEEINDVAKENGIPVIEDGAQSFGAKYKDKRSCGLSTIGSTSFFPSKPLGCYGDGGALFTNNDNLAKIMKQLRVHGQDKKYHHPRIGINGRLDTIQAAILLSKLERFDWEIEQRSLVASRYNTLIQTNCPSIITPYIHPDNLSVYAQYTIQVDNRDNVANYLRENGVPTTVYYPRGIHLQPAFSNLQFNDRGLPVTERSSRRVLSLPMSPDLSLQQQEKIVRVLKRSIN